MEHLQVLCAFKIHITNGFFTQEIRPLSEITDWTINAFVSLQYLTPEMPPLDGRHQMQITLISYSYSFLFIYFIPCGDKIDIKLVTA